MASIFDGCLAEWNGAFVQLLREVSGIDLVVPAQRWPRIWTWYPDFYPQGLTKEHVDEAWRRVREKNSSFWLGLTTLPWIYEAERYYYMLTAAGHDIYFITSRPGWQALSQTQLWLEANNFQRPSVIVTHQKGPIATGLELDHMIDDKPENLQDVIRARGTKCQTWMVSQPWNEGQAGPRDIVVDNVAEALQRIGRWR